MADLDLRSLGISDDEPIDCVVNRIADLVLGDWTAASETGRPHKSFAALIEDRVVARANAAIDEIAAKHVLPNVAEYVEKLCLQETNRWGEATGRKMTFVEYLVERAEAWIKEPVDYKGQPKPKDSFGWTQRGTRVSHMIHEYLDHQIKTAITAALKDLNGIVTLGLRDAVVVQIKGVPDRLKVKVET